MDFPLIATGKRFNCNAFFTLLDNIVNGLVIFTMFSRAAPVGCCFKRQGLINQGAEDTGSVCLIKILAALNLILNIMRDNRHGNKLTVGVGNTCSSCFTEIFKDKNIFYSSVIIVQELRTISIYCKEQSQVLLTHFMDSYAVDGVVDDDIMVTISCPGLLHSGGRPRKEGVLV